MTTRVNILVLKHKPYAEFALTKGHVYGLVVTTVEEYVHLVIILKYMKTQILYIFLELFLFSTKNKSSLVVVIFFVLFTYDKSKHTILLPEEKCYHFLWTKNLDLKAAVDQALVWYWCY